MGWMEILPAAGSRQELLARSSDFACAGSLQPAGENTRLLRTVTIFNIEHFSKQVPADMRDLNLDPESESLKASSVFCVNPVVCFWRSRPHMIVLRKSYKRDYNLTEDGYRQRFRTCSPEEGENPNMFIVRLKTNLERWMKPQTYEALRD
ncbi:hypothetical protein RRG08_031639 [Elysia crispata]|uniref:Uncharacterized protein n=1 Tax=Elysia crispata TaxID=231223 RepID=A0AAE1AB42_9GAST|nr:hypothetical protein RRG08_031639 [Elysia crispata]